MNRFLLIFVISLLAILLVYVVEAVQALEANVTVRVTVTVLPAYRLFIDLDILNKIVYQGSNLLFTVELKKKDLTNMSNKIPVNLNYEILKGNKVVKSGFLKTIYPTKCGRETLSISIPKDFSTGSYTLRIIATNPQSYTANDTDTFTVKRKKY